MWLSFVDRPCVASMIITITYAEGKISLCRCVMQTTGDPCTRSWTEDYTAICCCVVCYVVKLEIDLSRNKKRKKKVCDARFDDINNRKMQQVFIF